MSIEVGQVPTKEQLEEVRTACAESGSYDSDCPPSSLEALAEFAAKARELRRSTRHIKPAVTVRLSQDYLDRYKALGKGYTGVMADVLAYAADHPEILRQATSVG
jgi:uncharacterized protein (DUF4415 family)